MAEQSEAGVHTDFLGVHSKRSSQGGACWAGGTEVIQVAEWLLYSTIPREGVLTVRVTGFTSKLLNHSFWESFFFTRSPSGFMSAVV